MTKPQFQMTAVLDAKRLRVVSAEGSVLPRLSEVIAAMPAHHLEKIEEELLPNPNHEIRYRFSRVLRWVAEVLCQLPLTRSSHHVVAEASRQKVLELTELIMHEVSSFAEYLAKVIKIITAGDKRAEKAAQSLGKRLANEVVHLFRLPINKVKHDGYRLTWCEAKHNETVIGGFSVYGQIGIRTTGPATFHPKTPDIAEGYSFALFLRNAVEGLYHLCDIAETGIPGELKGGRKSTATSTENLLGTMREVLTLLPALPHMGFPGENRHELCELFLDGHTVRVFRTFRLSPLKPSARFTTHLPVVAAGHSLKLPFWAR